MRYRVFNRNWWIKNPDFLDGREPGPGKKHYHGKTFDTQDEARDYCLAWNDTHEPGELSNKCEFESI